MEEALRSLLLANAGVTALVGDRVYWDGMPRGAAYPAIVMHLIDSSAHYAMSGPVGLANSRVQVNCLGTDVPAVALAVEHAVKAAIDGVRVIIDGVEFQGMFRRNRGNLPDPDVHPPDEVHYDRRQDYEIWHSE